MKTTDNGDGNRTPFARSNLLERLLTRTKATTALRRAVRPRRLLGRRRRAARRGLLRRHRRHALGTERTRQLRRRHHRCFRRRRHGRFRRRRSAACAACRRRRLGAPAAHAYVVLVSDNRLSPLPSPPSPPSSLRTQPAVLQALRLLLSLSAPSSRETLSRACRSPGQRFHTPQQVSLHAHSFFGRTGRSTPNCWCCCCWCCYLLLASPVAELGSGRRALTPRRPGDH